MRRYIRTILILIILSFATFPADAARRKRIQVDTVGLRCRGVMESFAGIESGLDERLDFYVSEKLTHYFYCPSDDRYCNRWGWKFLYNDSDRHMVRNLKAICEGKGIEFVWTVNPGERYRWNDEDYKYLRDKLIMMYYNGIRSFAVYFPDTAGDYRDVEERLKTDFVATREEEVSLYMINGIPVSEYPSEGHSAVRSLMRGYHFDDSFVASATAQDAVICNILENDEFARLALISVAEFAGDPLKYSPDRTLADAVTTLDEDVREAFMTFLRHTGNVDESTQISVFSLDGWSKERSDSLKAEFDRIETVPAMMQDCSGTEIYSALEPWLVEFGRLGTRGKKVLSCMEYYKTGNLGAFWQTYRSSVMSDEEIASYQMYPVGESKLHPFCVTAMEQMKKGFEEMLLSKTHLHNLASTLYAEPNAALDSDFSTYINSSGHIEFAIPADADTCYLLTGDLPEQGMVLFRQIRTDGSLAAEFVVRSGYSEFHLKEGAVKVDIVGDVDVYENIFVYL